MYFLPGLKVKLNVKNLGPNNDYAIIWKRNYT